MQRSGKWRGCQSCVLGFDSWLLTFQLGFLLNLLSCCLLINGPLILAQLNLLSCNGSDAGNLLWGLKVEFWARRIFFFAFTISVLRLLKVLDMYYATSVKNKTSQVYSQTGEQCSGLEISYLVQDRGFDPTCCIFFSWARLVLRVSC